ncbi:MAG: RsmE family RNA methyltransferase [Bdellovibrionia bacterium]
MKKRLLCPNLPQPNKPTLLPEGEAHHATKVLRLRDGEIIEALDGKGHKMFATLRIHKGPVRLEYLEPQSTSPTSGSETLVLPTVLEMAVLKGEAMEWVIEKAVELGVQEVVPVLTAHTVVQMKNKGPESFRERWQKIADQALKQCGRLDRMEVKTPVSLESLMSDKLNGLRLWCDEASKDEAPFLLDYLDSLPPETLSNLRVLIGPEGGWSQNERAFLGSGLFNSPIIKIGLGPYILRAETAAIFATSLTVGHRLRKTKQN